MKNLRLIRTGWQSHVYDLNSKTVLKKTRSYFDFWNGVLSVLYNIPLHRKAQRLLSIPSALLLYWYQLSNAYYSLFKVRKVLKIYPGLSRLLGNPKFIGIASYTQDKVTTIEHLIERSDAEQQKNYLDNFFALTLELYSYNLCEAHFNILTNYGIASNGNFVLIDFGNVYISKRQLEKRLSPEYILRGLFCKHHLWHQEAIEYGTKQVYKLFGSEVLIANVTEKPAYA